MSAQWLFITVSDESAASRAHLRVLLERGPVNEYDRAHVALLAKGRAQ